MNKATLILLADSANNRAMTAKHDYEVAKSAGQVVEPSMHLNDFFYWSGKATAYRGIAGMMEMEEVGTCP